MLKKYFVYFDDLCEEKPPPQAGFTDHEVYLAADADRQINDLRQAVRVVLSEWKEIEGSKIQSELRKLLADSYRTPSAGERHD
jgi:hypothetical protein